MLELLARFLFVLVGNLLIVDDCDVGEAIDDKRAHQRRLSDLVFVDVNLVEGLDRLELRDLNERIDVVVHEEEALELGEATQFCKVGWRDYVVEADVLERDLLDSLLELSVVKDFKSVAVDKKFIVTFDLSVARLD